MITKEIRTGFNDITKNGIYYLTGTNVANRPPDNDTGGWWGICINMVHTNGVYVQIAIDVFNNRYTRALNNGTWTAWKGLLSNTDLMLANAIIKIGNDNAGIYMQINGSNNVSFLLRFDVATKALTTDAMVDGAWLGRKTILSWP